jgi:hypothetical protein
MGSYPNASVFPREAQHFAGAEPDDRANLCPATGRAAPTVSGTSPAAVCPLCGRRVGTQPGFKAGRSVWVFQSHPRLVDLSPPSH